MLYLDSAAIIKGVTVYRDYNDPKRFWYMPRHPRLTVEGGDPMFQLLIYRRDITDNPAFREGDRLGGGFLTMTVDLGIPQSTLDAIKQELSGGVHGEPILAPVPFETGSVRVTALGTSAGSAPSLDGAPVDGETPAGPGFVERILGSARPSMYGDNRAVFSMELSQEGAILMRASLEDDGASQVAVVYDLSYKGLMPAYQAKIKIQFRRSYEFLRTRFTMNTLVFKADLDNEFEKLVTDGQIQIEEIDFSGMEPDTQAAARQQLNELAKQLATWSFFRPGLTPGSVLAVDRGTLVAADPTTAAQAVTAGFSTPISAAADFRGAPGGSAGPRVPGTSGDTRDARAGGRTLPESGGDAGASAGAGGSGGGDRALTAVERWNQAGRPQAAYLMRSLNQEEQQDIEYNLLQVSAITRPAAPQGQIRLLRGASDLPGRIKEVDLADPFFETIKGEVTTTADLEALGVSSMVVKLRYGQRADGTSPKDRKEFPFTAQGDKGGYEFALDKKLSVELEYQVIVNYRSGFALGDPSTEATTDWVRTSTLNLDIDPQEVAAMFPVNVVIGQVDWEVVTSIEVTLHYDDDSPGALTRATALLRQDAPSNTFYIRPKDTEKRGYRMEATFGFAEGEPATAEFEGDGAQTLVLNQPSHRAVAITVAAQDPLRRFQKINTELKYDPPGDGSEQHKLFEMTGGESRVWTIFRDTPDTEPVYDYRVTEFRSDGSHHQIDWREGSSRLLVVGDVFSELLTVQVNVLVPDFAAAGLLGVKLKLKYPDAPEGFDDDIEAFFQAPPAEPFEWRVPKKPGGGDEYEMTVTWLNLDGTSKVVGPRVSTEETLLLHPALLGE